MYITAKIDISTNAGRKIACELEKHSKVVQIVDNTVDDEIYHSFDEVYEEGIDRLSAHYNVDCRQIIKGMK